MTLYYYIDSPDAVGRQEEIFGPDASRRVVRDRASAEAMLADCQLEAAELARDGDERFADLSYHLAHTHSLPEWAQEDDGGHRP